MTLNMDEFMPLITEASQAKTFAHNALNFAKNHDVENYKEKMKIAKEHLIAAHKSQTRLLQLNSYDQEVDIHIYLIHAMDHVTNAQMIYDMSRELAELHLKISSNKSQSNID